MSTGRGARAPRVAFWTAGDLATFLRHVEGDRLAPLLRLASHTGARRSELLGLRWTHLDLDAATMSVAGRRTRVGYEMIDRAGAKTAAGARLVDLDPTTVAVMARWREDQAADREAWGTAYVETGYVFTAENGEPSHTDYVAQRFARLVTAAGVPPIGSTTCDIRTRPCCSKRACPSTSSPSASGTPRPPSRCRSTATFCPASSPRLRPRSLD
jgi:integrase